MNKSKQLGTKAESAVVKYLHTAGFPHAERRSLRGALDAGDITGTPGVCWEVKGGDAARTASDLMIARWMGELDTEMTNAKADVGLLVVQRAGVGPTNAGRWWAYMPAWQVGSITTDAVVAAIARDGLLDPAFAFPVRMLLADAVTLLRAAGYGEPEPDPNACDTPGHPSRPSGWCPICHGEEDERAAALADLARPVVAPYRPTGALTATDTHLRAEVAS